MRISGLMYAQCP